MDLIKVLALRLNSNIYLPVVECTSVWSISIISGSLTKSGSGLGGSLGGSLGVGGRLIGEVGGGGSGLGSTEAELEEVLWSLLEDDFEELSLDFSVCCDR